MELLVPCRRRPPQCRPPEGEGGGAREGHAANRPHPLAAHVAPPSRSLGGARRPSVPRPAQRGSARAPSGAQNGGRGSRRCSVKTHSNFRSAWRRLRDPGDPGQTIDPFPHPSRHPVWSRAPPHSACGHTPLGAGPIYIRYAACERRSLTWRRILLAALWSFRDLRLPGSASFCLLYENAAKEDTVSSRILVIATS